MARTHYIFKDSQTIYHKQLHRDKISGIFYKALSSHPVILKRLLAVFDPSSKYIPAGRYKNVSNLQENDRRIRQQCAVDAKRSLANEYFKSVTTNPYRPNYINADTSSA